MRQFQLVNPLVEESSEMRLSSEKGTRIEQKGWITNNILELR